MKTLIRKRTTALLIAFLAFWTFAARYVHAAEGTGASPFTVSEITYAEGNNGNNILTIKGLSDQPPTFISYDLFDPLRIVIDIADGDFAKSLSLPIELNSGAVASVRGSTVNDQKTVIAKIEILLTEDNQYAIEKANNDIQVTFAAADSTSESPSSQDNNAKKEASQALEIVDATVDANDNEVSIVLVAGQPITDYERVELAKGANKPDRMYLDIHGAKSSLASIIDVDKGALARLRTSPKENGTRIVFDSRIGQLFDYQIDTIATGLRVTIQNPASIAPTSKDPIGNLISELSESPVAPAESKPTIEADSPIAKQLKSVGVSGDAFVDAGYDQERITVDFYKTNIENVFYLLKELSGRNFVVDEGVSGNVTLYLEKVPWDFILDVVLNLKGLQKVEKFNTIVISSKSKDFTWPENTAEKDLTFEAPGKDLFAQVDEQLSQPPEVIEAKMTIQKANALAEKKQFQAALDNYKKAFALWPDNLGLIKRIANFCLAEMGNFICAEDYAGKALALDENDSEAALQMAISRANMGKGDAGNYFEKATSGERPSQTALLNYAAYYENKGTNDQALAILDKYESIYERTLNTMIARARIYDKENQPNKAEEIYEAILLYTGFDLPADLEKFIKGRLALRDTQP